MAGQYSTVYVCVYIYIYHIIFIHFLVDGHSHGFHILEIINNAAMNIGVHVYFQISVFFLLNIYPGVEFLGHVVVLFLVFLWKLCCFPQWLNQFTFPPTVYKASIFSTTWPSFVICALFYFSHSDRWEMSLWFLFVFLWWLVILNIFSSACCPTAFSL